MKRLLVGVVAVACLGCSDNGGAVTAARMRKLEDTVDTLYRAADSTEQALAKIHTELRAARTEREIWKMDLEELKRTGKIAE